MSSSSLSSIFAVVALDAALHLAGEDAEDLQLLRRALLAEPAHRRVHARQHAGQHEQVDHDVGQPPRGELLVDDVLAVLAQDAVDRGGQIARGSSNTSAFRLQRRAAAG